MERLRSHVNTKQNWYAIVFVPFPSEQANGKHVTGTIAFPCEHRTKLVRNRCVPFPSEQANGKHANGTIAFPCEHKAKLVRNRCVPFPSEQANGKHVNGTIAFPSVHKQNWYAIVPFRSCVNSLLVRSRNWNEDGTDRLSLV